jgi:AcrR family transcriptional regulator
MAPTRDKILVATIELFRRQGYNGTALSQISEASGATIGSIYHFFPGGKEALAVAAVETSGAVYRALFEAFLGEATDPAEGVRNVFTGAAVLLAETDFIDPCPIGTIAREVANTSEPLRAAASRTFASWIDAAAEHLRRAGVPDDEAVALATLCVAAIEGAFVLCRTTRTTTPLDTAGRYLGDLVHQAIAGRAVQTVGGSPTRVARRRPTR